MKINEIEVTSYPPVEFKHGDCSNCHDQEMLLCMSEQEDEPLHYVCKECFLRGY